MASDSVGGDDGLDGTPAPAAGAALYTIAPDGSLDGVWTIAGVDGIGVERVGPGISGGLEGDHTVQIYLPGGDLNFDGTLSLDPVSGAGSSTVAYEMTWSGTWYPPGRPSQSNSFSGRGVARDATLAATWTM